MTPMEAIQAATIMPARAMRVDKDTGTIEVGKRADLAILAGNPLRKIANIETARWVVTDGRLHECARLWHAAGFIPYRRRDCSRKPRDDAGWKDRARQHYVARKRSVRVNGRRN